MITAPAIPAGDSLSPSRKNAKHAVITGHSVCSNATDRSDIFVNARFCIRYPRNVQAIARYRMISQAIGVVLSMWIPPSNMRLPPRASAAEHPACSAVRLTGSTISMYPLVNTRAPAAKAAAARVTISPSES